MYRSRKSRRLEAKCRLKAFLGVHFAAHCDQLVVWLGAAAVWPSPIYPSPMIDFGYDVSDYTDVHPLVGTLADFDALMEEAQRSASRFSWTLCRTTAPTNTAGFYSPDLRAIILTAIGTSGTTPHPAEALQQLAGCFWR